MKYIYKTCWAFLFSMVACFSLAQTRGIVKEGLLLKSNILDKEVRYSVYLPFDYNTSHRYYPVVYLLHGYTDDDTGWIQFGEAHLKLDKAIAEEHVPPMIIIMPDGGASWYANSFDGSVRYEDFFIKELMPHVEKEFRIKAEKRYRGIAGLSMGGFGSLLYSFKHPNLFSACAAFSAAIYSKKTVAAFSNERWNRVESVVYGYPDAEGEARLTQHFLNNSPLELVDVVPEKDIQSVRIYLDCGDDDYLSAANAELHIKLKEKNIAHEYRVRDGAHRWTYWRSGLIDGLKFIGRGFHQE